MFSPIWFLYSEDSWNIDLYTQGRNLLLIIFFLGLSFQLYPVYCIISGLLYLIQVLSNITSWLVYSKSENKWTDELFFQYLKKELGIQVEQNYTLLLNGDWQGKVDRTKKNIWCNWGTVQAEAYTKSNICIEILTVDIAILLN